MQLAKLNDKHRNEQATIFFALSKYKHGLKWAQSLHIIHIYEDYWPIINLDSTDGNVSLIIYPLQPTCTIYSIYQEQNIGSKQHIDMYMYVPVFNQPVNNCIGSPMAAYVPHPV